MKTTNKDIKKTDLAKLKKLHDFLKENNMELRGTDVIVRFDADKEYRNKSRVHFFDFDIGYVKPDPAQIIEKDPIPRYQTGAWYIEKNRLKKY